MKGGIPEMAGWPSGEEDKRREKKGGKKEKKEGKKEKKEEKTPVSSSKALFRSSSLIGSFYRIGI